ncbi:hypothetical protein DWB85_17915 [Seongchinamella sediminis]|uniref:PEP-CTERM protein-sorting domain-containing protein n=1 Tax=Seongchinamella sediminis TaxID=2283635 RepID=A0A3L7DVP2_9GAMM|nr:hypothetical protein [Seongchinamella sediminis]RLQ20373.1 hypothetical protein DWB85_17915 [Seongchinamella sediminis]
MLLSVNNVVILQNLLKSFGAVIVGGLVATSANASLIELPPIDDDFGVNDVVFRVLPGDYQYADAAQLLGGNDSLSAINALNGGFAGDAWSLLDKTGESASAFFGVTFELTAQLGATSGSFELSWSETGSPGLPLSMDFVFVSKAAGNWGAYLFESIDFSSDPLSGDGLFEVTWSNNGGQAPGLSHASIYGRLVDSTRSGGEGRIPLPGTLVLVGLGLGALRIFRRPS